MASGDSDPLLIEQGTDWFITLTLTDEDDEAVDISQAEFRGQIRKTYDGLKKYADFDFEIVDGPTGQLKVMLSEEVTKRIPVMGSRGVTSRPPTRYIYDIEWRDSPTGDWQRLLQGNADVSPEVTR